jgi:putative transposase
VRTLCRTLCIERSGYYAWLKHPKSKRTRRNEQLIATLKQLWMESGCVYGYRKLHDDLQEIGIDCSLNKVARLCQQAGVRAQIGYKRRKGYYGGKPTVVADNHLERQFKVNQPNRVWVTDITYIRTYEGWLYLAVVIDLYSRQVVGWSMNQRMTTGLVLDALLMAVWRRKPAQQVLVHSDQGSQYTSGEWQSFLDANNLKSSMSRRGNCHDNAVAESFFQLLKRERIRRRIYKTRREAKEDIFNYIEMFYNSTRKHGTNGLLSPQQYEDRFKMNSGVV